MYCYRNCLLGKNYQLKISDFGTDNEAYACDYYKVDGRIPLPLRWAAWESVLRAKYTTKSDVWAFAVTLHEIFTLCRRQPYEHLTDNQVRLVPPTEIPPSQLRVKKSISCKCL